MPSVTLDLPDELLVEINRVAQELNVPRNDVFRKAIVALSRSSELEARMDRLSHLYAEAGAYRQSLTAQMTGQRAAMIRLGAELEEMKQVAAAAAQGRTALLRQLAWLRTDAVRGMAVREKLQRERDAAVKAKAKMEQVLAERTYAAMNALEVDRLKRELAAAKKDSEKALTRQLAATHKAERESGRLRSELTKARKELDAIMTVLGRQAPGATAVHT